MTILYEKSAVDRWAGTEYAQRPMPPDHEIIAAIQKERGDLRRVAWGLGDLNVDDLRVHVAQTPALREVYQRAMWGVQ